MTNPENSNKFYRQIEGLFAVAEINNCQSNEDRSEFLKLDAIYTLLKAVYLQNKTAAKERD